MKEFEHVKDMICEEIYKIGEEGQLTMDALCVLDKLADVLKDLYTCEMYEENDVGKFMEDFSRENGYSGRSRVMSTYYDGNSYGNSYGNYNNNYRGGRRGGYSRDDAKKDMIEKAENMWRESQNEQERDTIKRFIDVMKMKQ